MGLDYRFYHKTVTVNSEMKIFAMLFDKHIIGYEYILKIVLCIRLLNKVKISQLASPLTCFGYLMLHSKLPQDLGLQNIYLLCPQILWVRNSDMVHQRWLLSAPLVSGDSDGILEG